MFAGDADDTGETRCCVGEVVVVDARSVGISTAGVLVRASAGIWEEEREWWSNQFIEEMNNVLLYGLW